MLPVQIAQVHDRRGEAGVIAHQKAHLLRARRKGFPVRVAFGVKSKPHVPIWYVRKPKGDVPALCIFKP